MTEQLNWCWCWWTDDVDGYKIHPPPMTPWTAAHQAFLSSTISWSLLKLKSIELVILSDHFIFCRLVLPLPSIFPSIRVFFQWVVWPSGTQSHWNWIETPKYSLKENDYSAKQITKQQITREHSKWSITQNCLAGSIEADPLLGHHAPSEGQGKITRVTASQTQQLQRQGGWLRGGERVASLSWPTLR